MPQWGTATKGARISPPLTNFFRPSMADDYHHHHHPMVHCCCYLRPSSCTACILRTQRLGYSPKNTCHLSSSTVKQQSPHENNKTAFDLVINCRYE